MKTTRNASLIAALLASIASLPVLAADAEPPVMVTMVCTSPEAAPTWSVINPGDAQALGEMMLAVPTSLMNGGTCADVIAVPEGTRSYNGFGWTPEPKTTVNVTVTP